MEQILKFFWYVSTIMLIFTILIHNPKSEGLGSVGAQNQFFSNTRSTENTLNKVTWLFLILFLILTTIIAVN
uniref:Probable protein-export membrane protein SecG n=1 Tax=Pyropia pulchra TaxID=60925 RepID=A0A141SFG7_9RHOD|nr:preprotein translocase subunit G [Pyropia pulchra]AMK97035.1 preprotein translocase subunit G [Pyropia pulchra]